MKKILLLLSLFLTLTVSGQIRSGVVASTGVIAAGDPPSGDPPSFLTSDGYTEGWYSAEVDNVVLENTDHVATWTDLSSAEQNLFQDTDGYRGTWSSDGVTFATTQGMGNPYIPALSQPVTIYMVVHEASTAANTPIFYFGNNSQVAQSTTDATWYLRAGGSDVALSGRAVNTEQIYTIQLNGSSSLAYVNGGSTSAINPGTNGVISYELLTAGGSHPIVRYKEIIIRNTADDATARAAVVDYLKAKYSISW